MVNGFLDIKIQKTAENPVHPRIGCSQLQMIISGKRCYWHIFQVFFLKRLFEQHFTNNQKFVDIRYSLELLISLRIK